MQWDDTANAGFTTGTPWIGVNPNYVEINARAEQKDPNSVFHFYRRLIWLRKKYPVFTEGDFALLMEEDEQIFAYTRTYGETKLLVCANFSGQPAECPLPDEWKDAETLIHNYEGGGQDGRMRPYEAVIKIR